MASQQKLSASSLSLYMPLRHVLFATFACNRFACKQWYTILCTHLYFSCDSSKFRLEDLPKFIVSRACAFVKSL